MSTEKSGHARLRAALAAATLPSSVRLAWSGHLPEPAVGQMWRARWGSVTQVLLVMDASARSVRAAPVTFDLDMADDSAVILPAEASDLTLQLVVWTNDAMSLSLRVLDRFLGSLADDPREVLNAPRGRPVLTVADERAVSRARMQDALDVFLSARWAPEGVGTLNEVLGKIDRKRLGDVLAVPDRVVIALLRGRNGVTPEQAERLAPVLKETPENLLAANPPLPEDLVADLDRPVYRAKVNALAHRRGVDEIAAWLTVGYSVAGVAHRQTEGDAPSWREQLDRYFQAVLDDQ
jgi:hypothetical protein